jgi:serine/threonine protein kinase
VRHARQQSLAFANDGVRISRRASSPHWILPRPAGGLISAADPGATAPIDQPLGLPDDGVIGRYRLLQPLGEGGWGMVYLAEQVEPVRPRVALKVIKLGMGRGPCWPALRR